MSVINVTKDNFKTEIMESDKPVLLDFYAAWCGPCRMVSPIIDEIAEETETVKVGKINVDDQPELARAFGVMSIPTLVVVKDGKIVNKTVGARPKAAIKAMIEQKKKDKKEEKTEEQEEVIKEEPESKQDEEQKEE